MANITHGINPTQVDTVAQFQLGAVADDPRGGVFAGNKIKYVKANASGVGIGRAVQMDVAATPAADRRFNVIPTAATDLGSIVHGLAHVAIAQNSFGWITVEGIVFNAVVPDALAVGNPMNGGAAGALVDATAGSTETAPLATYLAAGKPVILLEDTGTSLGTVWIGG
jgi:hypothetical protein